MDGNTIVLVTAVAQIVTVALLCGLGGVLVVIYKKAESNAGTLMEHAALHLTREEMSECQRRHSEAEDKFREENREGHRTIFDKLDALTREVAKMNGSPDS